MSGGVVVRVSTNIGAMMATVTGVATVAAMRTRSHAAQ